MQNNVQTIPSIPIVKRGKTPNCLIIETDLDFAMDIKSITEDIGLKSCAIAQDFEQIENAFRNNKIDIVIGEVQLNKNEFTYDFFNGKKNMPPIIFLSALSGMVHYKNSRKVDPYIYFKKPVDEIALRSAIEGALKSRNRDLVKGIDMQVSNNKVFIRSNGQMINLDPSSIRYIQSEGNYIYIFTKERKIAVRSSLKNALEMMNCEELIQVQRAYMINIESLTEITINENRLMIDGLHIPIGRKYKKNLIQKIKELSTKRF